MAVAEYPPKEMMEDTAACFDPNAVAAAQVEGVAFSGTDGCHQQQNVAASAVEEVDLHRHYQQQELMGFAAEDEGGGVDDRRSISRVALEEGFHRAGSGDNGYGDMNQVLPYGAGHSSSTWDYAAPGTEGLSHDDDGHHHNIMSQQVADPLQFLQSQAPQTFGNDGPSDVFASVPAADLLNLFRLARCSSSSLLPSSSLSFANPNSPAPPLLFDPLVHLSNLQPQPPFIRELFQSLPNCGYDLPIPGSSSLFGGGNNLERGENEGDEGNNLGMAMMYCEEEDGGHQFVENNNGVFTFGSEMMADMDDCHVKVKMGKRRRGKVAKPYTTERDRRSQINHKYDALKKLIPSPTKGDRASIVGDAIEYIKELLRTVNELKLLVEKKRWGTERSKRQKVEEEGFDGEISIARPPGNPADQSYNRTLRSSWLQRKSKVTEVDVRIIDDEVTIKLVQRKKINCLLHVSRVLDELQLDLHHVAGGHIGEHYSFLLNTKIYEGSTVYASAIASKLIEVIDRQYTTTPPTCSGY
ncbi:transcription factor bHLH91-like [Rhodamnia argentea]|uniref:Transcription factor bHLH91-like n=1 Tax=Rhodamnia argentea TaxID=178133 RepID=A0A8B8QH65_9MYRT|nr:transcription factor bHLH91-like [Rhodamnia argentea]